METSTDYVSANNTKQINVKRRLGLLSCVSFILGIMIGSGIYVSPMNVLRQTGSVGLSMVVWAACGLISLFAALVYMELGSLIPKSGGEHGYFLKAFGSFPAFMYCWVQIFAIQPGVSVLKSLVLTEYLSGAIFDNCGPPSYIKKIIAALVILSIAITNCISVRFAARIQILFTFIKLAGLIVIIAGGVIWMSKGNFGSLISGFGGSTDNAQNIALAFYSGLYAYDGWSNLNFSLEEVVRPKRNLPLAILISMAIVTSVNILVNISYLTVLTKSEFLSSWAVGVTWGEYVLGPAVILVPIVVASSIYGSCNSGMFSSGRLIFAAGREGHLPEVMSYINIDSLIPIPSLVFLCSLSFLFLVPGDIGNLLNLVNYLVWLFYGSSMIAIIVLRFKMKDAPRTVKVPLVIPVLMAFVCLYLVVAPFTVDPKIEFVYALMFLGTGAAFYFPFVFFRFQIPGFNRFTHFIQLLMEVVPTEGYKKD